MNQNLLSLMKNAGFVFWEDEEWKPEDAVIDWATNYDKEIEKFAELIVRDCIAIVEPSSYRRAYPENYRGGMDCLDTLDDRVEKIKEHFGVEV